MPNDREFVDVTLPSGEQITADIPAGMSDSDAKLFMQSRRPDLFATGAPDAPKMDMQQWGGNPAPTAGLPGSSPNPYSAGPGYTAAVGVPLGIAGAVMGGDIKAPAVNAVGRVVGQIPGVQAARAFAGRHPFITNAALSTAIAESRRIPYVGKMIPPGSELIPFLTGNRRAESAPVPEPVQPRELPEAFQPRATPPIGMAENPAARNPFMGEPAPSTAPADVQRALERSLGAAQPAPGVPIGAGETVSTYAEGEIPRGFMRAQSSNIRSTR